jgi:hypothetical protein
MASKHYFNFLGPVYENLPTKDRERLGEMWQGYEQIIASVYQKFVENDLNIAIFNMLPFATERWLPYTFNEETERLESARYRSNQDLSVALNLSDRYLIRFSIDGGTPIQVDLRGVDPLETTIQEIRDKINLAAGFNLASIVLQGAVLEFNSPTEGPTSSIEFLLPTNPARDASEFVLGILTADLPVKVPEFPFVYSVTYARVVDIPALRTHIRDVGLDSEGIRLRAGTDYVVDRDNQVARFAERPPEEMWAKRTLIDEESPWNNFGFLLDIYDQNSEQYLRQLQGTWFAFWNGPTPENVRRALYLLFTLPVALENATVIAVSPTEVTTESPEGIIRNFEVPSGLVPLVEVGQQVERFQPLVDGISVIDKINRPGFIQTDIGRANIQRFLTENATRGPGEDTDETKALRMLDEHTFLPQITVDAFITPDINLGNVQTFLTQIQPLTKTFLFQVIVGEFRDNLGLEERLGLDIEIDVTPNVDSNQTTFAEDSILDDYETIDDPPLNLDSDGILFEESVAIEVYSFGGLIDSFDA